jgi:hypothetical protein
MKNSLLQVLNKLRTSKNKGITFDDFPRGKDLRKRCSELRYMGYQLHTELEVLPTGCRRARYWLLREPV